MIRTLFAATLLTILAACAQVDITDYADTRPLLDIEQFFDGGLTAHGVVKDRSGKVIRTFNADIDAYWTDGVGTLVEDFVFDDGEVQQRIWKLQPDGEGQYIGTAGDVIGEGKLQQAGNALFLDYVLRLDYRGSNIDVRVDDRMYLVSPDILINESTMTKFGFQVGSLTLVIMRDTMARQ